MGQAAKLFLLELLLLLVFLPPFLLLPWGKSRLSPEPVVAVLSLIAVFVGLLSRYQAARAGEVLEWRAAAMRLAIGPGLMLWAAGIAWRLGRLDLAGLAFLGAVVLSLLLLGFPPPPKPRSAE